MPVKRWHLGAVFPQHTRVRHTSSVFPSYPLAGTSHHKKLMPRILRDSRHRKGVLDRNHDTGKPDRKSNATKAVTQRDAILGPNAVCVRSSPSHETLTPPSNRPLPSPSCLRAKDEGRRTKDEGPRTKDQGRRTKDEGRRTKDQGPMTLIPKKALTPASAPSTAWPASGRRP
jgi:hypothetical protein